MKPWASVVGNIYNGDDNSYYAYVSSIVNDFDLDFSNNETKEMWGVSAKTGRIISGHPMGTSVLLMPFYLAAKPFVLLFDRLTGSPFNQRHPIFFMFMCAGILAYAYWGACLLLRGLLLLRIKEDLSVIAVILTVWATILPAYIFKRPIFTPVPQFFLISALLYLTIKWRDQAQLSLKQTMAISLVAALIFLVRWNDIHILAFIFLYLVLSPRRDQARRRIIKTVIFLITVAVIFTLTQGLAWRSFLGEGYLKFILDRVNEHGSPKVLVSMQTFKNLLHIFFAIDWGLLYTMLPFALGLVCFIWLNPLLIVKSRNLNRIIYLLLFSLPFMVVIKWQLQGCYYGYRHLLSLLPFTCVGMAVFFEKITGIFPRSKKIIWVFSLVLLAFNFLLILPFEYTPSTTLELGTSRLGQSGWVNNEYAINAIKIYFISSPAVLAGMFLRGFFGGYIFSGLYLLFPQLFLKFANSKVMDYYILDKPDEYCVLFYPLLAVLFLILTNLFVNKPATIIKDGRDTR